MKCKVNIKCLLIFLFVTLILLNIALYYEYITELKEKKTKVKEVTLSDLVEKLVYSVDFNKTIISYPDHFVVNHNFKTKYNYTKEEVSVEKQEPVYRLADAEKYLIGNRCKYVYDEDSNKFIDSDLRVCGPIEFSLETGCCRTKSLLFTYGLCNNATQCCETYYSCVAKCAELEYAKASAVSNIGKNDTAILANATLLIDVNSISTFNSSTSTSQYQGQNAAVIVNVNANITSSIVFTKCVKTCKKRQTTIRLQEKHCFYSYYDRDFLEKADASSSLVQIGVSLFLTNSKSCSSICTFHRKRCYDHILEIFNNCEFLKKLEFCTHCTKKSFVYGPVITKIKPKTNKFLGITPNFDSVDSLKKSNNTCAVDLQERTSCLYNGGLRRLCFCT